uniref:Uncharacterized protein n=1 Tax=Cacopsylla melanoneura TaxID=428564 RepID=A0A8D8QX66_9HEMI
MHSIEFEEFFLPGVSSLPNNPFEHPLWIVSPASISALLEGPASFVFGSSSISELVVAKTVDSWAIFCNCIPSESLKCFISMSRFFWRRESRSGVGDEGGGWYEPPPVSSLICFSVVSLRFVLALKFSHDRLRVSIVT